MSGREHEDNVHASELAYRVRTRVRDAHRECPDACPLRGLWVEDVQELIDMVREES